MLRPYLVSRRFGPPAIWPLMTSRTAICIPTTSTSQDRVVPDSDEEGDSLLLCANSHAPLENERYRRIAEDIIEISDSDSKRRSGCSTIDLSDDSSVASLPPNQVAKSRVIVRQPVERPNPSPSKTQILQKLFEDSSDSDSAVLDLSRFRWKPQTQTHQPKPPLHSVRPTLVVPLLARNPSKSVRMVHTKNYSFTDAELGPLLRCVSCDVTWTTRKMVSNKLAHIRSCQKKHELDDDTIRERIQRELDSIRADEVQVLNPKKKRKPAPVREGGPSSLLEEIAQGVRPKQRRKAKEVVTTVIGIEHQHEFFSERAKRKFSLDSEENGETFSGESSSGTGEAGDRSKSPVLTQPFPSSKLGVNEPFHTGYSYELPMFAAEGNRVELTRTGTRPSNDEESAWEDEHPDVLLGSRKVASKPNIASNKRRITASQTGPSSARSSGTPTKRAEAKGSVVKSRKRAVDDMDAYDDASFYACMEAMIRDDSKLWTRVLTYDPVEFEVFLNLAAGDGPITPKLTKRVRDFLDAKAIHFITGTNSRGRKRR